MTATEPRPDQAATLTRHAEERQAAHFMLRLFITGMTDQSHRAIEAIRAICDQYLVGRYKLEVLNLREHPEMAAEEQIIAAPTLVREEPLPRRKLVGDLSRTDRVLAGLDIEDRH